MHQSPCLHEKGKIKEHDTCVLNLFNHHWNQISDLLVYSNIILCSNNRVKANRKHTSSAVGYLTEQIAFSARAL